LDIKYDIWLAVIKELDLHRIKHEEVDRLVENFVLLNELPLRIITGNSDKMRQLVIKVLDKHNIEYEQFKSSQITILK
tara:strand:- start:175 stop:408 length:234 start_codon:yes stop_codon:yes gene_type:complete